MSSEITKCLLGAQPTLVKDSCRPSPTNLQGACLHVLRHQHWRHLHRLDRKHIWWTMIKADGIWQRLPGQPQIPGHGTDRHSFLRVSLVSGGCKDKPSHGKVVRWVLWALDSQGCDTAWRRASVAKALTPHGGVLFPQQTVIIKTANIHSQTLSSIRINRNNPIHYLQLFRPLFYREAAGRKAGPCPHTPRLFGAGAKTDTEGWLSNLLTQLLIDAAFWTATHFFSHWRVNMGKNVFMGRRQWGLKKNFKNSPQHEKYPHSHKMLNLCRTLPHFLPELCLVTPTMVRAEPGLKSMSI